MSKRQAVSLETWAEEVRQRRAETRGKENSTRTMRDVRERERNMGQVCLYCGQRKAITEFHVKNICRLCAKEAKETPRGKRA